MALRIAARSTIAGTPVKSWWRTRLGRNEISLLGSSVATQPAIASASLGVAGAEHVLEEHPQRVRQSRDIPLVLERVEPEDLVRLVADP